RIITAILAAALLCSEHSLAADALDGATHDNWLHHGGTQMAWRYSALDQINTANVSQLKPAWIFQTGEYADALQSTPIVVDGVLYLSTNNSQVFALEAATGDLLWHFEYPRLELAGDANYVLFGAINRGVAVADGKVFFGTYDDYLIALDAKTGQELWKVNIDNAKQCGCAPRGAPLVANDIVIIGGAGGDGAHRGYLTAFDIHTGRLAWRWYTVPAKGEKGNETWKGDSWKHGGGANWMTGSYDPELNLVYWGTGNAASDFYAGDRVIDPTRVERDVNLYTASIVALDAATGKLKWHYQEIPNDVWDYDAAYEVILFDRVIDGKERKLLVHMNKSGLTFVLDRVTGEYINAYLANEVVNFITGIGENGKLLGRHEPIPGQPTDICPSGFLGGKSWNQMAYSPVSGLLYAPMIEVCMTVTAMRQEPQEGAFFAGGGGNIFLPPDREYYAHLDAIDPVSGALKWRYPYATLLLASVLATAGDLVFSGKPDGDFFALDAATGKELWRYQTGAGNRGSAVTYAVNGRQYIATATGWGSIIGPMAASLFPDVGKNWRSGSTLIVFALPEDRP
ncbi:MAG TPA: PQQ-dependent dehydrogenase, methanol/ethanol family, partial [Gammaproteobacteria bacterium]|nr:PQQ-dependent dehydrogenase, methanol/ethanol family [Gammaproteobacteria bacterium]